MKLTKLILGFSVCFLCAGILVADVDVTGTWDLTISSPRGERTRPAEFIQDGEALTIVLKGRDGQEVEGKGTVKGSDIEWKVTRETQRGTFEMVFEGEIEGETMQGTVQFGTRGSGEWSANRAK